jgi:hypothetical protein
VNNENLYLDRCSAVDFRRLQALRIQPLDIHRDRKILQAPVHRPTNKRAGGADILTRQSGLCEIPGRSRYDAHALNSDQELFVANLSPARANPRSIAQSRRNPLPCRRSKRAGVVTCRLCAGQPYTYSGTAKQRKTPRAVREAERISCHTSLKCAPITPVATKSQP